MIDLHLHSSASDGTDAPADVVRLAAAAGVTTLALTDHDTTAGWDEAAAAVPAGVRLLRGAEFSTSSPDGRGGEVSAHLLGYLFDPADPAVLADQERLRGERSRRVGVMTERLRAAGYDVDPAAIAARTGAPVGRPHVAQALVDLGAVESVPAAFETFLHKDGPYYEPKADTPIAEAIGVIRAAGGVPVWAHPWARKRGGVVEESVIVDMAALGLVGVEVDHPDHSLADRDRLRALAADLGLVVTGSSDYHGTRKTVRIAAETTAPEALDTLVARATGADVVVGGQ
ncbi:PHP domain-containing protein [Actinomycetospora sp. TBRC 11914]|uniref:PHP domain-containing protein n=1 Tax=Actinomycetospora sp. TBRC 11914 TaxID=2729387 RepID=UPI00145E9115|nr:PHP domain-containing protein [Actinomycetospora sp. TBRC 11914]NMO88791.1 PHP domain-containing protein [Actinomycetospora sp. TBRC 11914]